jgi:hypothetical protein
VLAISVASLFGSPAPIVRQAVILLLSHLAWGNMVSVDAPFKMQFYHFASSDAPLTWMVGVTMGSAPGVMVLFLSQSTSRPLLAHCCTRARRVRTRAGLWRAQRRWLMRSRDLSTNEVS